MTGEETLSGWMCGACIERMDTPGLSRHVPWGNVRPLKVVEDELARVTQINEDLRQSLTQAETERDRLKQAYDVLLKGMLANIEKDAA